MKHVVAQKVMILLGKHFVVETFHRKMIIAKVFPSIV